MARGRKFVWCPQCIVWWQSPGKWNWLSEKIMYKKNHVFPGHELSYYNVFIFSSGFTSRLVESSKEWTQNQPEKRSRTSKLNHTRTFLTVHINVKIDTVLVAGILCSLLASFHDTIDNTPWLPSMKPLIASVVLHVFFLYMASFDEHCTAGCKTEFRGLDLQLRQLQLAQLW